MNRFEYVAAPDVGGALAARRPDAAFKAGGMDLLDLMKSSIRAPGRLVNLLTIDELKGIDVDTSGATIGALATLAEIADHPDLARMFPALALAAGHAATPQVRNVATIGGNILQRPRCWYFRMAQYPCLKKGGDTCFAMDGENKYHAIFENSLCAMVHPSNTAVALLALDAVVRTAGSGEIPIRKFFVTPDQDILRESALAEGELVTQLFIPATGARSHYLEFRERQSFDWALVSAAAAAELEGQTLNNARVVLGSVAPIPWRIDLGEIAATDEALDRAADEAVRGATPLAKNKYKVQLARTAIRRSLRELARATE
ncbi:MAG: hypothetical protein A3G34_14515 [Candidatus Lindowbacteria bacterium RIFCSPLOWO2_12_FULL_62_27]|nr:MAG: hypothetical protein A3I06_15925 [Candidatus Lindowbacteria bacterium RIFCSPLOWO2_02_FULL_62_12]OGH63076.1 MAG: hypothetical protein A3G34_14515 [Candidatus Lindowbacteria bacterium RIFCSPLOWO2_12_FULL_62_27]